MDDSAANGHPCEIATPVNTSPAGDRSVEVPLAYLKGNDPESEEAQEHANSGSLALYI